jgi:Tat protein secretion system quality control protein TatD with DNase activity
MPTAIKDVVDSLAELRQSTPEQIETLVQRNFTRLIGNDPWIQSAHALKLSKS